jgi:hypothetical protein
MFERLLGGSQTSLQQPAPADEEKFGPVSHEPQLTPLSSFNPATHPALTGEQEASVAKLKAYIESIMLPESDEYYKSERGFVTDSTVKRYMRARKWDYEVSIKGNKNCVAKFF